MLLTYEQLINNIISELSQVEPQGAVIDNQKI